MTARSGQAALEFLTTYGWAIMVVLVMIGALSYFGVLNPQILVPDRCLASPDLACEDFLLTGTSGKGAASVVLGQGVGRTIYFESVTCEHRGLPYPGAAVARGSGASLAAGDAWSPRDQIIASCAIPALEGLGGVKERLTVLVAYRRSSTGFIHEGAADITSEVVA